MLMQLVVTRPMKSFLLTFFAFVRPDVPRTMGGHCFSYTRGFDVRYSKLVRPQCCSCSFHLKGGQIVSPIIR